MNMGRVKTGGSVLAGRAVATGSVYVCSRCAHTWVARKKDGLPKNCPKCRSTVWMKDYHICKCARCGHQWGTVDPAPKRCPECGTNRWDRAQTMYSCQRCSYAWASKRAWKPKRCPRCRSTRWEVPAAQQPPRSRRRRAKGVPSEAPRSDLTDGYLAGQTVTQIAMATGTAFSEVYAAVREAFPGERIRI